MFVDVEVGAEIRILNKGYAGRLLEHVKRDLTIDNPAWLRGRLQNRRISDDKRYLRMYSEQADGSIRAPRGYMRKLRATARRLGKRIRIRSEVCTVGAWSNDRIPDSITLRDYQKEAIRAMQRKVQCMIDIATGGGKTFTGCSAIVMSGEPAIVIVHTSDLMDQWIDTFRALGKNPRAIGGGGFNDPSPLREGEVAVCMVQTLCRTERWRAVLESAGALLIDEAHHVVASNYQAVLSACPARFRWGVSATMERADGLGELFELLIGPVGFSIGPNELIEMGFLRRPKIFPVRMPWRERPEHRPWSGKCPECDRKNNKVDYHAVKAGTWTCSFKRCSFLWPDDTEIESGQLMYTRSTSALMTSPEFIRIASELAHTGAVAGRAVLVLVGRKNAAAQIAASIISKGTRAVALVGSMPKSTRERALRSFRNHELNVIVATQLGDEGLDLPRADLLVLGSQGQFSGTQKQRIGRVLRPSGAAEPLVADIVAGGPYRGQWRYRLATYLKTFGQGSVCQLNPLDLDDALRIVGT